MADDRPYWERKQLHEMTREEWEGLCDGCGRCCLVTLEEDEDDETIAETSLHCRLFDSAQRRCTCYEKRTTLVPECVELKPSNVSDLSFMPPTCAYRRLGEGKGLPDWHPLLTGTYESVVDVGVAVPRDLINESDVKEEDYWRYVTGERRRV